MRATGAEAARLIRSREFAVWVSFGHAEASSTTAKPTREALDVAAGALLVAARDAYAEFPDVKAAADRLTGAVRDIDPRQPLREERHDVIAALEAAAAALEAIDAAHQER